MLSRLLPLAAMVARDQLAARVVKAATVVLAALSRAVQLAAVAAAVPAVVLAAVPVPVAVLADPRSPSSTTVRAQPQSPVGRRREQRRQPRVAPVVPVVPAVPRAHPVAMAMLVGPGSLETLVAPVMLVRSTGSGTTASPLHNPTQQVCGPGCASIRGHSRFCGGCVPRRARAKYLRALASDTLASRGLCHALRWVAALRHAFGGHMRCVVISALFG